MSPPLLNEVKQFLSALEATQEEFAELFRRKRTALTQARADELLRLAESEAALAQRLQAALGHRQRILQGAGREGLPCKSLAELTPDIAGDESDQLQSRIERARRMSDRIRQESWIHWIIANRTCSHYTELLNLIANCGRKAPTYSQKSCEESRGGVILDASI